MTDYQENLIKSEILRGLLQVDSSFFITSFETNIDKNTRQLTVNFTAEMENGKQISEVINYA